jgi:hypothetical protein
VLCALAWGRGLSTTLSYLRSLNLHAGPSGTETVLRSCGGQGGIVRVTLQELLASRRARLVADTPGLSADDAGDPADVVLSAMSESERAIVAERAAHIREVLTGYRSGAAELATPDEPRPRYDVQNTVTARYEAKAAELGASLRTITQWVADFRQNGDAGLARSAVSRQKPLGLVDERWVETALEVMVERTDQSRPSPGMVIDRASARVVARYGPDVVKPPGRATAYRILEQLENRHPTFRLSTKRNRDIADRPDGVYGKLRPTRPGEYLLMDTTRLDVFALDPLTLRWVQAELTVGMDWYTRCVTGIRLTPVSTKSVDAAAVLNQAYRPRTLGKTHPIDRARPDTQRQQFLEHRPPPGGRIEYVLMAHDFSLVVGMFNVGDEAGEERATAAGCSTCGQCPAPGTQAVSGCGNRLATEASPMPGAPPVLATTFPLTAGARLTPDPCPLTAAAPRSQPGALHHRGQFRQGVVVIAA